MIFIGFALRNPWSKRFVIVFDKAIKVTRNKSIEITLYKNTCLLEFGFSVTSFKQDHAGFSFDIGVFGYNFEFMFSDNRHYGVE
jgi:hypothetical protein